MHKNVKGRNSPLKDTLNPVSLTGVEFLPAEAAPNLPLTADSKPANGS